MRTNTLSKPTPAHPGRTARTLACAFCAGLFTLLGGAALHGFPPAPYYTLYGMVRDQVGQVVTAQDATLILLKDGEEVGRTPITSGKQLDQNYELNIRIDQNRTATALYSTKAVTAQGLFSLVVQMDGALFYPIEVQGNLTAGKGGERVKLDLNLGADSDGDGLPDVWEQWQLHQAGQYPDENGNWALSLIDKNGDFDGDGVSNWLEYIAGTFAGDATERLELKIMAKQGDSVRFEFFEITGKTYTIERTTDFVTWTRMPFAMGAPGAGAQTHTATDVGIRSAFATTADASTKEFYRLTVR
jgi:hypothetical protein